MVHLAISKMASEGVEQVFCIHDCFGSHANDIEAMRRNVLLSVREIFSKDILSSLKEAIEASIRKPYTLPNPPKNEGFPIDSLLESEYFVK